MTTRIGALAIISPSQARQEILDAIIEANGKLTEAAQLLGLYTERKYSGLRTLYRVIADLGMWADIENEMQRRGIRRRAGRPLGEHEVRRVGTPKAFQRGPTAKRRSTPRGAPVPLPGQVRRVPGPEPERKAVQLGADQSTPRLAEAELREAAELSKRVGRREKTPAQAKKKEPRIVGVIPPAAAQAAVAVETTNMPTRVKTPTSRELETVAVNVPSDVIDRIRQGKQLSPRGIDSLYDAATKAFQATREWKPSHSMRDWLLLSGYATDVKDATATLTLKQKGDEQASVATENASRGFMWNSQTDAWEPPLAETLPVLRSLAATSFARYLSAQTLVDSGATVRDALARSYAGEEEAPKTLDEAATIAQHNTLAAVRFSDVFARYTKTLSGSMTRKNPTSKKKKKRR